MNKQIVFLSIIDGSPQDYKSLQQLLLQVSKNNNDNDNNNFEFIVAPKQIESISISDIKKLIEVFENDKHEDPKKDRE